MSDGNREVTAPVVFGTANCSLKDVLERIGDKWSILVIAALSGQPSRFRSLQRRVDGISQRMLTLTLRRLERDGLVVRTVFDTRPPQVEYALTELGDTLTVPLRGLASWAEQHRAQIAASRSEWDDGTVAAG